MAKSPNGVFTKSIKRRVMICQSNKRNKTDIAKKAKDLSGEENLGHVIDEE